MLVFSVNSAKKVEEFVDGFDSANSRLIANLSYTMCISRISHYIKCVIRDKIGSIVDVESIQKFFLIGYQNLSPQSINQPL